MTSANDVLDVARGFLGTGAAPNAVTRAYKPNPAYAGNWCAVFVHVCADLAGDASLISASAWVDDHRGDGAWLGRTPSPRAGDLVFFDWNNNGYGDHIGIVESVTAGTIQTIEGNTSDRVARRVYPLADYRILGYTRPAYSAAQGGSAGRPAPSTTPQEEDDMTTRPDQFWRCSLGAIENSLFLAVWFTPSGPVGLELDGRTDQGREQANALARQHATAQGNFNAVPLLQSVYDSVKATLQLLQSPTYPPLVGKFGK